MKHVMKQVQDLIEEFDPPREELIELIIARLYETNAQSAVCARSATQAIREGLNIAFDAGARAARKAEFDA